MNDFQEFLVAGLPNVNTKTAKSLLKHFRTPEKIFAASEAKLQEVDGLGPKTAKNIRKILSKRYEKSILED
jgi:Fanconi anemia group M protein